LAVLHIKLSRDAKALRALSKTLIPHGRLVLAICREIILQLEKAQEERVLSAPERSLIRHLKSRILGLASAEKSRARQRSRLVWLRKGDANTRFFHVMASARKKRNFIHSLATKTGFATTQTEKHVAIYDHFLNHIGSYIPRSCALNYNNLNWQPRPLNHLETPVDIEELHKVIMEAPKEKAPGPDGFIDLFFSACWEIIKVDLMKAVQHFFLNEPARAEPAEPVQNWII
jgi:hypothetical protein